MTTLREAVAAFLAERDDFITAIENCHPDNRADYWRWKGHAEARRVFREGLERDGIDLTAESTPPAEAVEADEAPLGKPCSCFARDPLPGRWHYPVCSYYREPPAEPTPERVEADLAQDEQAHARYYAQAASAPVGDAIEALVQEYGAEMFNKRYATRGELHSHLRGLAIQVRAAVGGQQSGVTDETVETVCSRIYLTWEESHAESKRIARRDVRAALEAALLPEEPTS